MVLGRKAPGGVALTATLEHLLVPQLLEQWKRFWTDIVLSGLSVRSYKYEGRRHPMARTDGQVVVLADNP